MIYKGSLISVCDNSGGKFVKCLHLSNKNKFGTLNSLILVSLKKVLYSKKVKKKLFYLGLIVCLKYWKHRYNGFYIKFTVNKVLLFSLQLKPLGSRVFGLIDCFIKKSLVTYKDSKFMYKMLGLSCKVI